MKFSAALQTACAGTLLPPVQLPVCAVRAVVQRRSAAAIVTAIERLNGWLGMSPRILTVAGLGEATVQETFSEASDCGIDSPRRRNERAPPRVRRSDPTGPAILPRFTPT